MSIIAGYMVPHPPIIVEEVGHGEEQKISKTLESYRAVAAEIADLEPETIVVTTPHSIMYSDYNHISPGPGAYGSMAQFRAPEVHVDVEYDQDMVNAICDLAERAGLRAGTLGEKDPNLDHATIVPLYFVNKAYKAAGKEPNYKLVRIGLSGQPLLDQYALGVLIKNVSASLGRKVVFIASGDLSHYLKEDGPYGFHKEGPVYDEKIMKTMGSGSFGELLTYDPGLLEAAGECGHRSFTIMAGAFDGTDVKVKEYSHEDTFGVGYGICSFKPTGDDSSRNFGEQYVRNHDKYLAERKANEDAYVSLARRAIEEYVTNNQKINVPSGLPEEMTQKRAGTFVSLHIQGELRGCIGTTGPVRSNIAEEIIENAISAATRDPRFEEVTPAELHYLEYSVDVLGETEPVESKEDLDVKKYGVIVTEGGRRGLLLPNLDGVSDVDQQIAIAKRKAGIKPEEEVSLERFQVVRHY